MNISNIMDIADDLSEECQKSYREGDSFYTTRELASKLRVSATTANRILQLLEKRGIIKRSQRNGSVILAPSEKESLLDVIVVFRATNSRTSLSWTNYGIPFVQGIQGTFPGAEIKVVETSRNQVSEIWELVESNCKRNSRNGFVLWSMPIEWQRFFTQSRYVSAIFGSRFPLMEQIIPALAFRPSDGIELIIDFFRNRKRKKYLCLHGSSLFAGDILYLDAIQEGLIDSPLIMKALPFDLEVMQYETVETIKKYKPDAIICQNVDMARCAFTACKELGLEPGKRVDILSFFSDFGLTKTNQFFPSLVSRWSLDRCGAEVAKLLARRTRNEEVGDLAIPLDFNVPEPLYPPDKQEEIFTFAKELPTL